MVASLPFLFLAVAITSVLGYPQVSRLIVHESRRSTPSGWSLRRRADPDVTLPLNIALVQSNIHNLERYLLDIADPASPNYGKHWTPAKVADTFRPPRASVDAVHSWLSTHIAPERIQLSSSGTSLLINASVSEAEDLLATKYYVYQHDDTGVDHIACESGYHLPEHVSRHVDLVTPTVHFHGADALAASLKRQSGGKASRPGGKTRNPKDMAKVTVTTAITANSTGYERCDEQITLTCLRDLYNFDYNFAGPSKSSIAVVEYGVQNYNAADLDTFFQDFAPAQVGARPPLIGISGGTENPSASGSDDVTESNMDFMLVMGLLGKKLPVMHYQIGGGGSLDDGILSAFDKSFCPDGNACTKEKANVVSVSYVSPELITNTYQQRQCDEYGKLSLTGTTFVFASGDYGVAYAGNECLGPDHSTEVDRKGNFFPAFPATCPYVTAVGATHIKAGKTTSDVESAVLSFGSGGGFSNMFARPSFQDGAVGTYLSKYGPSYAPGVYNASGRGFPDVSANGDNTVIVENGQLTTSGGTSAAAPIFASMLAAVNDARISAGKGPVGWINPALYSSAFGAVFNDVTDGSNPNCGTAGFQAAPGWDPVTGLGTPHFPALLSAFMALP